MLIKSNVIKSSGRFRKYGLMWQPHVDPLSMELDMIANGGQWQKKDGSGLAGEGLFFHYKRFQELAWPFKVWQRGPFKNHWAEECLNTYLNYQYIGAMGCAGSGKSDSFGGNVLTDWYAHPRCTTVLVSSTDLKSLELRIWGMIKKYHRAAKDEHNWLPGHLIEGKQMLVLDHRNEAEDGRDFKNGIIAVACRRGNSFVGLGPLVGIHNKRVRLLADECNLMPRAFLDAAANLSKCEDFKLVGLGNPNETTNAHGMLCEPSVELGGWEGGIDQTPGTKTWATKFPKGVCIQLPGGDSPNMRTPESEPPPFPFLITREQMDNDAKIWSRDDWHFTMMNEAKMPRGQGSRRVLTRQACQKFGAFKEPNWRDSRRTRIAFVDAAYRGVGGDRCVFGELQFGYEVEPLPTDTLLTNLISQNFDDKKGRQIIALIDLTTIPISSVQGAESPEDQIVKFVIEQCDGRGITPEHFFYDAGMRTSLVQAFARAGWQQSNSIDCGSRPSEGQVSSEIRTPCRDYYSKFVTELWFSVRMAVESGQFRGMTEDACTEFCQREWKMVSGNKIEIESKDDMKLKCFIAGTLIRTPAGDVPIESLREGDEVETPFGPSRVYFVHENESNDLTELELSDGSKLTGTSNHKVFSWDRGWTSMDELTLQSKVEHVNSLCLWHIANLLFTKTTSTTFKHLVDTISAAGARGIRSRREFYTGWSGLTTLGRFLKTSLSTTLMEIGRITASTTLSWLIQKSTPLTTCACDGKILNSKKELLPEFQTLSPNAEYGGHHQKVENGMTRTQNSTGLSGSRPNIRALFVDANFQHSTMTPSSAQKSAQTDSTFRSMTTFLRRALSAAKSLCLIATTSRRIALKAAQPLTCGDAVKVYNLTLLKHNAYYANGILVANCGRSPDLADAVAVGLFGARQKGFQIAKLANADAPKIRLGPDWRTALQEKARKLKASGLLNHAA